MVEVVVAEVVEPLRWVLVEVVVFWLRRLRWGLVEVVVWGQPALSVGVQT